MKSINALHLTVLFFAFLTAPSLKAQVEPLSVDYFAGDTLTSINTGTSAGAASTFMLDQDCETLRVSVADPANAPLGGFSAYAYRIRDADGNQITDLTDNLNVTMRVRSAATITIGLLFRSGGGTADERSELKSFEVTGGDSEWTEVTINFEDADLGGLNPADIRDLWFYLDRGTENFAGNELYLDHIAVGGEPDSVRNSSCSLDGGGMMGDAFFADYFAGDSLISINTESSAGLATIFAIDTSCETLKMSIADPVGSPLGAYLPYALRLRDAEGNQITDLTDRLTVSLRARSAAEITIGFLFRSGGGSAEERTSLKEIVVPAGLDEWTDIDLAFSAEDLAGLNPADIRDCWFYLDRGTDNFAGNELYLDHIAVGGEPDSDRNSSCSLDGGGMMGDAFFVDYFQQDSLNSINTESSAGLSTTFTIDTTCETLILSVTDPTENPLGEYFPYAVRVNDVQGNQITDLTDRMTVTMRVRSAGTVSMGLLFRSGGGSAEERTTLKTIEVPGGLDEWSEFEVNFTAEDLEGLNPADIRDFWFYLERGVPNFPGNFIEFDHIAIGGPVDPNQNSPCTISDEPTTFLEQWQSGNTSLFEGSEAAKLSLIVNEDCEELMVSVNDPENTPLQAFRPLVINPVSEQGVDIKELEGEVNVYVRARSAADMPLSVVLRSGDGSPSFRTNLQTKTVVGTLDAWTTLVYTFSEADLAGFDQTDLLDAWIYLDQENDNFPGNELYFDYIAIGEAPDTLQNSPCGLPDVVSGNNEPIWNRNIRYYPNPVNDQLTVQYLGTGSNLKVVLIDALGRSLSEFSLTMSGEALRINTGDLASGVYYLRFYQKGAGHIVRKLIKR